MGAVAQKWASLRLCPPPLFLLPAPVLLCCVILLPPLHLCCLRGAKALKTLLAVSILASASWAATTINCGHVQVLHLSCYETESPSRACSLSSMGLRPASALWVVLLQAASHCLKRLEVRIGIGS